MIENLCENCFYNGSVFELCEFHRLHFSKKFNQQYDEFYKDCKTELQVEPCMVALGSSGMIPPALNEYTDFDSSVFFKERSDIPVPEGFSNDIERLKGYMLQPKEIKHMLDALHNPDQALASWEFDKTFKTKYSRDSVLNASFTEEYDMEVLGEILQLLKKVKKVKRIE
jgi:hypothetical protein